MRIEIINNRNSTSSLFFLSSNLSTLISQSETTITSLQSLKSFSHSMNGGIGLLQGAVDSIDASIVQEETRKSNLVNTQTKINGFVELVSTTDKAVSNQVRQNQDEFYKVNAWVTPIVTPKIGVDYSIEMWLNKITKWMGEKYSSISTTSVGGIALGTIGLFGKSNNGKSKESLFSIDAYANGLGSSGNADDHGVSGSLLSGNSGINARIAGVDASIKTEGELVGGSAKYEMGGQWDVEEGEIGVGITGKAEGHLAKGSVSGNFGLMSEKIESSVGNVSAKGEAGITLMSDGEFAPAVKVEASAGANVAQGSVKQSFGTDELDVHSKAEGELLTAKAKAGASVGVITYTDEQTDAVKTKVGAEASAGAEAYVAQGTAKGGVNLFGLKVDVGVSGKAGGAGVKVGGSVSTAGASGEVGAGLGLGLGLKVDVDWTEFKPEKILPWNWL